MFSQANHRRQARLSSKCARRHSSQSGTKIEYYQYHQSRKPFLILGLEKVMPPGGV